VENEEIQTYLGRLFFENKVKEKILSLNGIERRHYALNADQKPTHDVYQLGALAAENCLESTPRERSVTYLSAGSTNTPLVAPGLASLLHAELSKQGWLQTPVEINSNSGTGQRLSRRLQRRAQCGPLCGSRATLGHTQVKRCSAALRLVANAPRRQALSLVYDGLLTVHVE
jgi:hypothetical protein